MAVLHPMLANFDYQMNFEFSDGMNSMFVYMRMCVCYILSCVMRMKKKAHENMKILKSTSLVSKLFVNCVESNINGFVGWFVCIWET